MPDARQARFAPPAGAPLLLIGGGGHAQVVASAAMAMGWTLRGFFDDDPRAQLAQRRGVAHLGPLAALPGLSPATDASAAQPKLALAIGGLAARERVLAGLTLAYHAYAPIIVHPSAEIDPAATLAAGAFVAPRAVVNAFAHVSFHATINTGAIIEHECVIGVNAHVAPGAVLGGNVAIGDHTLVGLGSRVLPGVRVGQRCTIGAGAVVTRDIADGCVVVGVPARLRVPG